MCGLIRAISVPSAGGDEESAKCLTMSAGWMVGETEMRALDWIGNDAVDVNKGFTGNSKNGK